MKRLRPLRFDETTSMDALPGCPSPSHSLSCLKDHMAISNCTCADLVELDGERAEQYLELYLVHVCYVKSGWLQLFRCKSCHQYWELEWKNSKGGFDSGITTIHRLSDDESMKKWEHCLDTNAS